MLSSIVLSALFSSCSRKDRRKAASLLASQCHINLMRKVTEWVWLQMEIVRLEVRQRRSQPSQSDVLPPTCCTLAFQCALWRKLAGTSAARGMGLCVKQVLCRKCVHVVSSHSLCGCFSLNSWNKYVCVCVFDTTVSRNQEIAAYELQCWFGLNTGISCWV